MAGKTEYKNNWQKENVDRINLTIPKGCKAIIQNKANANGQSINGYINEAIEEKIKSTFWGKEIIDKIYCNLDEIEEYEAKGYVVYSLQKFVNSDGKWEFTMVKTKE